MTTRAERATQRRGRTRTRGATLVEFVIVILPVMTLALTLLQVAELYTAKIALDHAAANAARSASVVMADDPKYYGGEPINTASSQRTRAVKTAAARALAPFVLDGSIRAIDVAFPGGVPARPGADFTVEVRATYRCGVPLVHRLVCSGGGVTALASRATFASNAASFGY